MVKMKGGTVILGVLGSSVVCLWAYLYWNWTGSENKGDQGNTSNQDNRNRKQLCQRKLNFRVDCGDGVVTRKSTNRVKVFTAKPGSGASPLDVLLGLANRDEALPEESESFASSFTSVASFDDESGSNTGGEKSDSPSNHSSSESDTRIAGTVGVSTYNDMEEGLEISTELNELTNSPIVRDIFTDHRFQREERRGEAVYSPSNVVVEYEGPVIPVDVTGSIQNVSGTYSSIVPPLQPNTRNILPTNS